MALLPAFNARLIEEVKKHPELYNHTRRGSADTAERMKLWDTIATTIDPTSAGRSDAGKFAKQRWLQLRDRYRKELKAAIRSGFCTPVKWIYFHQLSWLDPYLKDNLGLAHSLNSNSANSLLAGFDSSFANFSFDALQAFGGGDLTPKLDIDDFSLPDDSDLSAVHPSVDVSSTLQTIFALMNGQTTQGLPMEQGRNSESPILDGELSNPQSVDMSNGGGEDGGISPATATVDAATISARLKMELDGDGEGLGEEASIENGSMPRLQEEKPSPSIELSTSTSASIAPLPSVPSQLSSQMPATSIYSQIKEQYRMRQAHHNIIRHNIIQTCRNATDWMNDEDLLYSRIIGLRLKKMDGDKKKRVLSQIFSLLEESDGDGGEDTVSSKSSEGGLCANATEELNNTVTSS